MKLLNKSYFSGVLLILPIFSQLSYSVSVNEFLSLTYDQKIKYDKFKDLVSSRLPHDYMRKDIYLIRWFRESRFDVELAEEQLMAHLLWREENKLDTILEEDFNEFDDIFRTYVEGCDRDGKPVVSVVIGDWDVRGLLIAGKAQKLSRYSKRLAEEAVTIVNRMIQAGQNTTTQGTLIIDLGNFNVIQHACPRCIAFYLSLLSMLDHYPGFAHKIIAVNVPQIAVPIYDLYKHFLPKEYRDILYIFGRNKKEWQRFILKEVDKDQLSRHFGGSKPEATDYQDLRISGGVYMCTNTNIKRGRVPEY